jgi:hypothetical protein
MRQEVAAFRLLLALVVHQLTQAVSSHGCHWCLAEMPAWCPPPVQVGLVVMATSSLTSGGDLGGPGVQGSITLAAVKRLSVPVLVVGGPGVTPAPCHCTHLWSPHVVAQGWTIAVIWH